MNDAAEPLPHSAQTLRRYDRLELGWLPVDPAWTAKLDAADRLADPAAAWAAFSALANTRMDFVRTLRLDRSLQRRFAGEPPPGLSTRAVRLAVLGSSTVAQVLPAIRVAGLRRGLWITTYLAGYGQYLQELTDAKSPLHDFSPDTVLFAQDARHLLGGIDATSGAAAANAEFARAATHLNHCWSLARRKLGCTVLQQTVLPIFPGLLGNNEHRLPGSRRHAVTRLNTALRDAANTEGIDLVAVDQAAAEDGIARWYDPILWHRAKQEVNPRAAPFYGELVAQVIAARQGRSAKCLVLDLDNTIWGGVVGDDGVEGLILGQGSALGEAYIEVQLYARDLAKRGIILAVISKNDPENAMAPFERHPEMVLRRSEIAAFVANWDDKATNLRRVAQQLNIGLDALVFLDDNPFERNLVRQELPQVAVPEVPDDPALVPMVLADAGYFESLAITDEDRERTALYQANQAREASRVEATDLPGYLRGLDMEMVWRPFDRVGLQRTVQLINKTNQFNLTTRRYTEDDVLAVMADPNAFGLQLRLLDRFGDNGIIAIVIGRMADGADLEIDTWLMSCRVLGRQVEEATLAVVADAARRLGARRLIGAYRPTAKNGMVERHYPRLGFAALGHSHDGETRWGLTLEGYVPMETFIATRQG